MSGGLFKNSLATCIVSAAVLVEAIEFCGGVAAPEPEDDVFVSRKPVLSRVTLDSCSMVSIVVPREMQYVPSLLVVFGNYKVHC